MRTVPLRHLSVLPITNGLGLPGSHDNANWPRYVRTTDIESPTSLREDVFASQPPEIAAGALLERGDLLMTAAGASIGKSVRFPGGGPACYAGFLVRVRPRSEVEGRFLGYWMQSQHYWDQIAVGAVKSTIENFSAGKYRTLLVPQPDFADQARAVGFLDRVTTRIDTLILEQERLIELLNERREAAITTLVTEGLDPAATRRPTGIPSLGSVPVHWDVLRLKNVGESIIGLTYAPDDIVDDGGTLVLRAGNLQRGRIDFSDVVRVSSHIPPSLRLRLGDIVICARNGSARLVGKNAIVSESVVGETWGAFMVVLRSDLNGYLRWVLNSQIFKAQAGQFSTSTINQLTSATLNNLWFALPPESERVALCQELERVTGALDGLVTEAERLIDLARERRVALITAAVTGQIDVPDEVA